MRPDDFPAEDVDREELRGDLAADDLAVRDDELFDAFVRPDLAELEPPPLLRPIAAVFDRADVVLRDEDDLELPLFDEDDLELPLFEPPLLLRPPLLRPPLVLRDDPLLLPPLLLREVALRPLVLLLRPPVELLRDDEPPRLDELLLRDDELLLRPPLELFFDEDEPPDDRLLLVAAAPFLPAALFFADDELREEPPDERELDADFFAPPLDERELDDDFFAPPLDERELEVDFFELPPDEERDDEVRDEPELFFELPPLLELDDEREPLDFLVVAMRIIPPIDFGMILHKQRSAICVPFAVLYQVETS